VNGLVPDRFYCDAEGRRLRLWNSQAGYIDHVYSGLDVVFGNPSSGRTKHFYANGLHIAENRSGVIEYYHQDPLRSTRLANVMKEGVCVPIWSKDRER
jgi:hypothetical protein